MQTRLRSSTRAIAIAALSASLGVSCDRDPSGITPPDATGDAPIVSPGSAFTIVQSRSTYVATSTANPSFTIEIDCDDETTDGRYFGVAPVIDGRRLQVSMYGGPTFPILTPDFDAGSIRCTRIESDDARLIVGLEAGTYKALDPAGPDEPVPLTAAFSIEGGHLVARASGLYYLMLTRASTVLRIAHGTLSTRMITNSSAAFTETFDDVTSIAVDDSTYGRLSIDAVIARLQVQLYDDGSQGIELDLDHAFKDRGQISVMSTITVL
jgi:hypothetical protein